MGFKQIDCFKINMMFFKFIGLWPGRNPSRYYKYYSVTFLIFIYILYSILPTINFFFIEIELDLLVEEMLFYFTELAILSKALTVFFMREKIQSILDSLECDIFQPEDSYALRIIDDAKKFIKNYYTMTAVSSYVANLTHVLTPLVVHLFQRNSLALTLCGYFFIPENIKEMFIYPLYVYQSFGMHFYMIVNLNTDTFIIGVLNLTVAQLHVLNYNLRRLTDYDEAVKHEHVIDKEHIFKQRLHKCIAHFLEIDKFCNLIQNVFSVCLFVQFSASSCIICVVLFRFTLPASTSYYIFLITYTIAMMLSLMPTWFGTRIMETSSSLSIAINNCDWISRPRQFKSSMMLFVERMNKPLSITAWKMFPLLLTTFTKIMNTAYSFFTLLRNMQTREH